MLCQLIIRLNYCCTIFTTTVARYAIFSTTVACYAVFTITAPRYTIFSHCGLLCRIHNQWCREVLQYLVLALSRHRCIGQNDLQTQRCLDWSLLYLSVYCVCQCTVFVSVLCLSVYCEYGVILSCGGVSVGTRSTVEQQACWM